MSRYNYIKESIDLLDMAAKIVYDSSSVSDMERNKFYDTLLKVVQENIKLKHWDYDKDTRNSRQRIANKKLQEQLNLYLKGDEDPSDSKE